MILLFKYNCNVLVTEMISLYRKYVQLYFFKAAMQLAYQLIIQFH